MYEIDVFTFTPEVHTLTIMFNLTSGEEGIHYYNFTGIVRESESFTYIYPVVFMVEQTITMHGCDKVALHSKSDSDTNLRYSWL